MNETYYTLKDVAIILRTKPYRIAYQLVTRRVPEPIHIGNRRAFTLEDIRNLAVAMGIDFNQSLVGDRGRP